MDEIKALEAYERQSEESEHERDMEIIREGGSLIRTIDSLGWQVIERKVKALRAELASKALELNGEHSLDYIRGQAAGAQAVVEMVHNAIEAAQDALRRVQAAESTKRAYRQATSAPAGDLVDG